jgi:hypothetical protein
VTLSFHDSNYSIAFVWKGNLDLADKFMVD